ncbi:hypothetical protein [Nitrosococcus wardiae]|uniref:Uncharacterized protein n=1 Tax=Nitrosococcus wardiae TaxID=1814290 RepID=A0A4P7C282_9GAMM|nr:hypothetical protein [Nitrosococcus wardiae]QBQ55777.1 hypothetical protein E3U44_15600 [Nitrosococcus wardiae]
MLSKVSDSGSAWYPVPIKKLDTLLIKAIYSGRGYSHPYALRRNIAYNLQYLEYLDRTVQDLKLSSVLLTQTWKSFVIAGCGIIESLLHYLLIANGAHAKTKWDLVAVAPGNSKTWDGEVRKVDSHVYKKRSSPRLEQMRFDAMIKKSESKKVLGCEHSIYPLLKKLRPLRNKFHLQEIGNVVDTDWNAFNWSEACFMAQVIQRVFTSTIFNPNADERGYFDYLSRYHEI